MAQAQNTKAAEQHEAAAKLHRSAAECCGKNENAAAKEHCTKAVAQSEVAHKSSVTAQEKTAAAGMKK